MYRYEASDYSFFDYEFIGIDFDCYSLLSSCLDIGRLPSNPNELLYFSQNDQISYSLSENLTVYPEKTIGSTPQNFTVVGIIGDNFEQVFHFNQKSTDFLNWYSDYYEFENYLKDEIFLTNPNYLISILNNFSFYNGIMAHMVDINYNYDSLIINDLHKTLNLFPTRLDLPYSNIIGHYVSVCDDLQLSLVNYLKYWSGESSNILKISAPVLFILGLICVVTMNIGTQELDSTFRLMKRHGLKRNTIRRILAIENLLINGSSLIIGSILGFSIGSLLINFSQQSTKDFQILAEPVIFLGLLLFFVGLYLFSFLIKNSVFQQYRETPKKQYGKKRENLNRIFSTNEFRLLVITLSVSVVILAIYISYSFFAVTDLYYSSLLPYSVLFWLLISVVITLVATFVFLLLTRVILLFWNFLSKRLWAKIKNNFSLSIIHMFSERKTYQIIILASFIFSFCIFPGFIMNKSIEQQNNLEATLMVGSSDLIITDWSSSFRDYQDLIENLTGVDETTFVSQTTAIYVNELQISDNFIINLLSIDNISEFLSIADYPSSNYNTINDQDILALQKNNTVLTDKVFATEKNLILGENFSTKGFTSPNNVVNLTFINSFEYFPLTPLYHYLITTGIKWNEFSIVGNNFTISFVLEAFIPQTQTFTDEFLLIDVKSDFNIQDIKDEIGEIGFEARSFNDFISELNGSISIFTLNFLIFESVFMIFVLFYIGYFTAIKLFENRLEVIEILYRIGKNRSQILMNFTYEVLLITSIPLAISLSFTLPLLRTLSLNFLGIYQEYHHFSVYLPWWLVIVSILLFFMVILTSWFSGLIPLIRKYRPIKQE